MLKILYNILGIIKCIKNGAYNKEYFYKGYTEKNNIEKKNKIDEDLRRKIQSDKINDRYGINIDDLDVFNGGLDNLSYEFINDNSSSYML